MVYPTMLTMFLYSGVLLENKEQVKMGQELPRPVPPSSPLPEQLWASFETLTMHLWCAATFWFSDSSNCPHSLSLLDRQKPHLRCLPGPFFCPTEPDMMLKYIEEHYFTPCRCYKNVRSTNSSLGEFLTFVQRLLCIPYQSPLQDSQSRRLEHGMSEWTPLNKSAYCHSSSPLWGIKANRSSETGVLK